MNVLGISKLTNLKWLNLYSINNWIFASRKNLMDGAFDKQIATPDAVVIVPLLDNPDSIYSDVVLIEQFREPIQKQEISFPAGLIDPNESLEDAVRRELFEETGLTLKNIVLESPQLFSSSGMTDESVKVVWADCEGKPTFSHQEEDEKISDIFSVKSEEIMKFITAVSTSPKHVFGAKAYLILHTLYVATL